MQLPEGIVYIPGSVVESTDYDLRELDVTESTALSFASNDITIGDSVSFGIDYIATMDAIEFQSSGGVFRNNVGVVHDDGFEFNLSPSYNILYPALSIIDFSPRRQTPISSVTAYV